MFYSFMSNVFYFTGIFLILYMLFVFTFYLFIFFVSAVELRRRLGIETTQHEELLYSYDTKPVSILVPAYNEQMGIVQSVRSLLSMNYPEYEIVVINDGSKDNTLQVMIDQFSMEKIPLVIRKSLNTKEIKTVYRSKVYKHVYLVDKENGGKADALNAGINVSKFPYFCSLDGDSILERDAFLQVMKPIIDSNGEVIAVGGSVRIANGCKIERGEVVEVGLSRRPLVIMQVIEYLRAFLMGRIGLSKFNILLIVSGAFGVFHKDWVLKAGGYNPETVGEDMELVVRLHRLLKDEKSSNRIEYIPDPVCWTEAPESIRVLQRQRSRWQRGLFETLSLHRGMLFNPQYKSVGLISLPYFLLIELFGAVVEFLGYIIIIMGITFSLISWKMALLLFCLSLLYGSFLSMCGVLLEEWSLRKYPKVKDLIKLFFMALSETFWYRPMTTFFRIQGLLQARNKKHQWGDMERKGVSS
jgi:cellulose synthase/poly-beta-1,6-N-acetylglucosamine synthase-like glycosyltransferase